MEASKAVGDEITLVENTGLVQQSAAEAANPYMDMFQQRICPVTVKSYYGVPTVKP